MIPKRNILIFHQAALGDFVLTWPVAMALSRVFAQSRVMYVTGGDKGRLVEQAVGIEAVDVEQGWHELFAQSPAPAEPVTRLLKATQCVVLFAQNPEPQFVANVAAIAGDISFFHVAPNPPPGVHVFDHQAAQFEHAPQMQSYVRQMQNVIRERGIGTPAKSREDVLIHPGSGSAAKNWPLESFLAVARRLVIARVPVRFVLGEIELDRWPAADRAALANVAPVTTPRTLIDLHRTLRPAAGYLGNDSGPTHLAALLGVRTAVLHGPATDPACWAPTGPRVMCMPFNTSPAAVADDLTRALEPD